MSSSVNSLKFLRVPDSYNSRKASQASRSNSVRPSLYASGSRRARRAQLSRFLRRNQLFLALLAAGVVSVAVGVTLRLHRVALSQEELWLLGLPGELLISMLRLIVIPLVVCSLISGVTCSDRRLFSKFGAYSALYFFVSTLLAAGEGILLAYLMAPASRPDNSTLISAQCQVQQEFPAWAVFVNLLRNLIPDNIIEMAFTRKELKYENTTDESGEKRLGTTHKVGQENVLGLLVVTLVTALALRTLGEASLLPKRFCIALYEVIVKIVYWILWFSPLGVLSIFLRSILEMDDLTDPVLTFLLVVIVGLLFHALVILPLIHMLVVRKNPLLFLGLHGPLITALATASSLGTLPVMMREMAGGGHLDHRVVDFVMPVGACLNLPGTALYHAAAGAYVGLHLACPFHFEHVALIGLFSMFATLSAAGVPSASLVTMTMVLSAANYPASGMVIVLTVDWILNRLSTAVNVLGDCYAAAAVQALCLRDLQLADEDGLEEFQDLLGGPVRRSLPCGPLLPLYQERGSISFSETGGEASMDRLTQLRAALGVRLLPYSGWMGFRYDVAPPPPPTDDVSAFDVKARVKAAGRTRPPLPGEAEEGPGLSRRPLARSAAARPPYDETSPPQTSPPQTSPPRASPPRATSPRAAAAAMAAAAAASRRNPDATSPATTMAFTAAALQRKVESPPPP